MSDREQKVLDELEQEFGPPSPPDGVSRRTRIGASKRRVAAAVVWPFALLLMFAGLTLNNVLGIAISVLAYVLIVASLGILFDNTPGARAAFVGRTRPRPATRPPGYFR